MAPNHITSYPLFFFLEKEQQGRSPSTSQHALCSTPPRPSRLRELSSFLPSISTQPTLQEDVLRKDVPRKHLPLAIRSTSHERSSATCSSSTCFRTFKQPVELAPTSNYLQKSNVRPLSTDEFSLPSINTHFKTPLLRNSYSSRSPSLALIRYGGKKRQHF
jgi:hypothetical protein